MHAWKHRVVTSAGMRGPLSEQTYVSPTNADLAIGASENLLTSVQIPVGTAPGAGYRLLFYADWRRQVSERNEVNNWAVSLPFTVIPPQYVMIGPLTPCSPNDESELHQGQPDRRSRSRGNSATTA